MANELNTMDVTIDTTQHEATVHDVARQTLSNEAIELNLKLYDACVRACGEFKEHELDPFESLDVLARLANISGVSPVLNLVMSLIDEMNEKNIKVNDFLIQRQVSSSYLYVRLNVFADVNAGRSFWYEGFSNIEAKWIFLTRTATLIYKVCHIP